METSSEVKRIQQVYRKYAARGLGESKWSPANEGNRLNRDECQNQLATMLKENGFWPLEGRRILDVGCGSGEWLATLEDLGAQPKNLHGVDLMPERILAARKKHPGIEFKLINAESLPFPEKAFDLVMVFTVFTSILDRSMAENVSREITRVLARGGGIIWYDFRVRNPLNRQVRGISRTRVQSLFPNFKIDLRPITLLPPLARGLGRLTNRLYAPLNEISFLRTHYLGILTKP